MNYLISAYSVNPYKGSEDSIGWNWVLQYEKNYKKGDRIILLTKKFNEKDTRRGLKEFNIQHVELVIVDVPAFKYVPLAIPYQVSVALSSVFSYT